MSFESRRSRVIGILALLAVGVLLPAVLIGMARTDEPPRPVPPAAASSDAAPMHGASAVSTASSASDLSTEFLRERLPELRAAQRTLGRPPYLRYAFRRTSDAEACAEADNVIATGLTIGGHPAFSLDAPVDWAADPYHDRSWRFHLNAWTFLEPVMMAFESTGEKRYVDFARQVACDWIAFNEEARKPNDFAWYDMAAGRRAAVLAVILDDALRRDDVPEETIIRLVRSAERHADFLGDLKNIAMHSNHGLYQLAGLLALTSSVPGLEHAGPRRVFALSKLEALWNRHFSDEGIHLEHSPEYQVYLVNFLGVLLKTGWVPSDSNLDALFRDSRRNLLWMIAPNGHVVRVGDSDGTEAAERILDPGDGELQYVLTRGERGRMPARHWTVFRKSGYAIYRSPWSVQPWEDASLLFFSACFHSRGHKQADDFTFEWFTGGQPVLIDAGRFAYEYDDPRRKYIESTRAHNTVEIDGRNYSRVLRDAFGSAITACDEQDGAWFVEAEVNRKRYFDTRHRRVLVLKPGAWLVVIDHLSSDKPHAFTQWFHFDPGIHMEVDGTQCSTVLQASRRRLRVAPLGSGEGLSVRHVRGQKEPRLQGWTSLQPGSVVANDALGFAREGGTVTFATLFRLCDDGQAVAPGDAVVRSDGDAISARWRVNGRPEGFHYVTRGHARQLELVH